MTMSHRVLLVEDDASVRRALADALHAAGYTVVQADDGVQALAMMSSAAPDIVVSDVRMADMDGLTLLRELRTRRVDVPMILMTAFDDMDTVVEAMKRGASEFLVKPIDLDELLRLLQRALADRALRKRQSVSETRVPHGALIGRDPRMIDVFKLIGQAAHSGSTTVLIRGESGTGKELVARAIHGHSRDSAQPFVPVNCAALPLTLLESELFGHVRGSFTGASNSRRGRFAAAGTGTIFLDEIGDTSLDLQTKLLRVLQDREYQPVGSDETERTEARVLAATHQPLERLVSERRFREDLYYRLRVMEIVIPPLRERRGDIPLIAEAVLQRAADTLGAPPLLLAREARDLLCEYSWPGNVRELENCLMRAAIVARSGVLRADDLSLASPAAVPSGTDAETQRDPTTLRDIESEHIARVLGMANGHKGRAAELLGIPRARLNRLLQKYGLE